MIPVNVAHHSTVPRMKRMTLSSQFTGGPAAATACDESKYAVIPNERSSEGSREAEPAHEPEIPPSLRSFGMTVSLVEYARRAE